MHGVDRRRAPLVGFDEREPIVGSERLVDRVGSTGMFERAAAVPTTRSRRVARAPLTVGCDDQHRLRATPARRSASVRDRLDEHRREREFEAESGRSSGTRPSRSFPCAHRLEPAHPRHEDVPCEPIDVAAGDQHAGRVPPWRGRASIAGDDALTDRTHPGRVRHRPQRGEHRTPHVGFASVDGLVECREQHPRRVDRIGGRLLVEFELQLVETAADERDQDPVAIAELVVQRGDGDTGPSRRACASSARRDRRCRDDLTDRCEDLAACPLLSSTPSPGSSWREPTMIERPASARGFDSPTRRGQIAS